MLNEERMLVEADNIKNLREKSKAFFISRHPEMENAGDVYDRTLSARISRGQETLLRNGGDWFFAALYNDRDDLVSEIITTIMIKGVKQKVWKINPHFQHLYGEYVMFGKDSYQIARYNLHQGKVKRPAKIFIKNGQHVKFVHRFKNENVDSDSRDASDFV